MEHVFKVTIVSVNEENKVFTYENIHHNFTLAIRDITTYNKRGYTNLTHKINREMRLI